VQSSPRARWTVAAAAYCAGAVTAFYRFLATASFPNDEHEYLAGAHQILLAGEWPTRDFFDPGRPLMYVASAAAQVVFGHTLFAEAVLTSVALGLAAALVLIAAHRLSTSLLVAAIATLLCVALFPRPYAYPKILLYAAGPLVMWAWLARPTFGRIFGMAAIVVIAFLLRHDHGVYLGGAVAATIVLAPANGSRERLARLATFGALVVVLVLPYIIYVETSEGLGNFLRAASAYSSREAERTALRLDEIDWGHDARLFYGYYLLPIAMLACFAIDWRRRQRVEPALVVPLAALALVINVGFLRDPLAVRLPDAAVLPALCGAWLAGRGLQASTRWRRVTAVTLLGIVTALATSSIVIVGNVSENLNRTDLGRGLSYAPTVLRQRTAELQERFALRHIPSDRVTALVPFFEYLDRCTTVEHRLFVAGYAPELFTYARRLFAGGHGQFIQGYQVSPSAQQRIVERLERQFVLFALMLSDEERQWRAESVTVAAFIRANFEPMTEISLGDNGTMRVLVRTGADALRKGTDKATGWACYR
jgi:4-amino-4-deoxy-L-arabinose transferase-like glycosyltransferase